MLDGRELRARDLDRFGPRAPRVRRGAAAPYFQAALARGLRHL